MTQIIHGIFIGNNDQARSVDWLRMNKITHIVNCTKELDNYFPEHFNYLKLHLRDLEQQSLTSSLEPSFDFIQKAVSNSGRVLIHCNAGISRSSSILIYYLMRINNWKFFPTLRYVQNIYPKANPNIGFGNQLVYVKLPDDEIL